MTLFDKDSYLPRVVLIPSAVFLSAIFGGAYGSGREVVEFMTRYGPIGGLLSIAARSPQAQSRLRWSWRRSVSSA